MHKIFTASKLGVPSGLSFIMNVKYIDGYHMLDAQAKLNNIWGWLQKKF